MRYALILVCGLLAGCAGNKLIDEARSRQDAEIAECERKIPPKPATPRYKCIASALNKFHESINDPHADLARQTGARVVVAAERFDAGKITQAELDLERATAVSAYHSEINRRRNEALTANSAAAQADAANSPRTCVRSGNVVNCF